MTAIYTPSANAIPKALRPAVLIAHFRSDIVSGAERSIADLVDHIKDQFAITMLIPREGSLADFYRQRGIDVWVKEIQNFRRRYPGLHQIQSFLFARELNRRGFQAVLCNTFAAASRVGTTCQVGHIPYAIYIREYIADRPINRKILAGANNIFVISKDLQAYVGEMADLAKIRLTYNHINPLPIVNRATAHRTAGQLKMPFPAQNPVVGLVGRVAPFKQQDLFVRAIPKVLAQVPEARFVIVGGAQGKDEEYEASVKALAASLGVEHAIAFLGHRTDNVELTSEMTITCLTSTREPLGRVILEGYLLGVPVIASDAGGAAEIVDDEVTGLKFDATAPDACEQLSTRITHLLQDGDLRERLAAAGREKVYATFAGDLYVRTQANYIQNLCEQNEHIRQS